MFGSAEECRHLSCAFLPAVLKLGLTLQSLAGGRHHLCHRHATKGADPLVERQARLPGRHKLQTGECNFSKGRNLSLELLCLHRMPSGHKQFPCVGVRGPCLWLLMLKNCYLYAVNYGHFLLDSLMERQASTFRGKCYVAFGLTVQI